MGHRLRMTAELGEWLAELSGAGSGTAASDAAIEVGASLVAIMAAGDAAGLPFVTRPGDEVAPAADPREALDAAYQLMLEHLQRDRLRYADLATSRQHLAEELDAERQAAEPDAARIADVEHRLEDARQREAALGAQSERLRAAVDAFRTRKETAKAMYTAAEARRHIDEAFAAAGLEPEADDLMDAAGDAEAKFEQAQVEARRLLGSVPAEPGAHGDLLELRADELGADVRILFAIEPEGTVAALAVLEGTDAISEYRDDAVRLAGELLDEIRRDGWPEDTGDSGPEFASPESFLERFFPGRGEAVLERAVAVASAVSLRGLRGQGDLTLADLAHRSGYTESHLAGLERGGLRAVIIDELATYVRAAGGTLRLTVDVDGECRDLI
jgi:hypothetical protein